MSSSDVGAVFRDYMIDIVDNALWSAAVKTAFSVQQSNAMHVVPAESAVVPEGAIAAVKLDILSRSLSANDGDAPDLYHGSLRANLFPHCVTGQFSQNGDAGMIFCLGKVNAELLALKNGAAGTARVAAQDEFDNDVMARVLKNVRSGIFRPALNVG